MLESGSTSGLVALWATLVRLQIGREREMLPLSSNGSFFRGSAQSDILRATNSSR